MPRLVLFALVGGVAFCLCLIQGDGTSLSQERLVRKRGGVFLQQPGGGQGTLGVSFPEDRQLMRSLDIARQQISQQKYQEAVRLLGDILEKDNDYFFRDQGNTYTRVKQEVQNLIAGLPPEGRAVYDTVYGVKAQQQLDEAAQIGDRVQLGMVASRYFHTKAGYAATVMLGDDFLDRGEPLAAAVLYERLSKAPDNLRKTYEPALSVKLAACRMQAGQIEQAKEVLAAVAAAYPNATLEIGERSIPMLAKGTDPLSWLRTTVGPGFTIPDRVAKGGWTMPGGGPTRLAASPSASSQVSELWPGASEFFSVDGQQPKNVAESHDGYRDEGLRQIVQSGLSRMMQQYQAVAPKAQPLIIEDTIVVRSATQLLGYRARGEGEDIDLGKPVWWVNDPGLPAQLINLAAGGAAAANADGPLGQGLLRRIWGDATWGTLSSDGDSVFAVEGLPFQSNAVFNPYQQGFAQPQGGATNTTTSDLSAYSLQGQGRLVWRISGKPGGNPKMEPAEAKELEGAFFLGPPLPLGERLYVIADINARVCLVVLEQEKYFDSAGKPRLRPRVIKKQALCDAEIPIEYDGNRQTCGATPSYSDGVLVCPTGAGAIVGVDVTSGDLMWAYTYGVDITSFDPNTGQQTPWHFALGWADFTAKIADGKVVLTPPGSTKLHCIGLMDGKKAWEPQDAGDALYVGAVQDGKILLVGKNGARAIGLEDGKPAWAAAAYPRGTRPIGRGYHSGANYCVPLSDGVLALLDVKSGQFKTMKTIKALHKRIEESGVTSGNLACAAGVVVVHDAVGLNVFHQVSPEEIGKKLQANPNDVEALVLQGEMFLQDEQLEQGIASLRRVIELDPSHVKGRKLLAEALLEGLKKDFATYRHTADELDRLTDSPELKARFLYLLASGLHQAREIVPALDVYLKLADVDASQVKPQDMSPAHSLRHDRWVRTQLGELRKLANAEERKQIDDRVLARLTSSGQEETIESLRRKLDYFGNHPPADQVRRRLVELLWVKLPPPNSNEEPKEPVPYMELELLLREMEGSADAAIRGLAVARLGEMYYVATRWTDAAHYFRRLQGELAEQVVFDGLTGRQYYEKLLDEDPYGGMGNVASKFKPAAWPLGAVTKQSEEGATESIETWVPVWADRSSLLDPISGELRFRFEGGQKLVAVNGIGNEQWRVDFKTNNVAHTSVPYGHRIGVYGHLVVFSNGHSIYGLDGTLESTATSDRRILWRHNLTENFPGVTEPELVPASVQYETMPWGERVPKYVSQTGAQLNALGPVVGRNVAFVRGKSLLCVEGRSGATLWTRHDLELGSDVFGDDELLFVVGPAAGKARMIRAADGQELGQCDVPPRSQRMAVISRKVLSWEAVGSDVAIALHDLETGKPVWAEEIPNFGTRGCVVGVDEIATVDQRGKWGVFRMKDGSQFGGNDIGPLLNLAELHVYKGPDVWVFATNDQTGVSQASPAFQGTFMYDFPLVIGKMWGVNPKNGKMCWSKPHEVRTVANLALPKLQPDNLPVLALISSTPQQIRRGDTVVNGLSVVSFLDKRNGQVLLRHEFTGATPFYNMRGANNSRESTVTFATPAGSVKLKLTSDAWPEEWKEPELAMGGGGVPEVVPGQPPGVIIEDFGGRGGRARLRLEARPVERIRKLERAIPVEREKLEADLKKRVEDALKRHEEELRKALEEGATRGGTRKS